MNRIQLVAKQMRQRALGTSLTLLSVLLGVALAISILLLRDAGEALFGQTEYGYDVVVGIGKGSPTQLVMNTVYHIDKSPGNVPYWVYEQLNTQTRPPRGSKEFDFHRHVKLAVPTAVGDTFKGRPIIGTLPKMFVSLAGLQKQLADLIEGQSKLRQEAQEPAQQPPSELARRQEALAGRAGRVKEVVQRTDREVVPLLDVRPAEGTVSKYLYGEPVFPKCDGVVQEMRAAATAFLSNDAAQATAHQGKAIQLLDDVLASVNANTGPLEYRPGHTFQLAEGRTFHPWKFEALLGAEVAQKAGLNIGDKFRATHGQPARGTEPDVHPEQWQVVGVLKPTYTAADRCLYIPLLSFYTILEHSTGLAQQERARSGEAPSAQEDETPKYRMVSGTDLLPDLPGTKDFIALDVKPSTWEVSAIAVRSRGGVSGDDLIYFINNGGIPDVQAVVPARVMQEFFDTFLKNSTYVLLIIALLVSVVAGVGILVSIYNSVAARTREIAILRALGATRGRVLTLICAEAILIGLLGALMGLLVGHGLGAVASFYLDRSVGEGFNWVTVRWDEWMYVLIVLVIALLAGLVPALKAYQTPVATNLVAA